MLYKGRFEEDNGVFVRVSKEVVVFTAMTRGTFDMRCEDLRRVLCISQGNNDSTYTENADILFQLC